MNADELRSASGTVFICVYLWFSCLAFGDDSLVSRGLDHFYNLEYDQAIADFAAETTQTPDNASAWNQLAYAIQFRAMFRGGALESELVSGSNPFLRRDKVKTTPAEDKRFDDAVGKAMELAQARLRKNSQDPKALYSLGAAYGLRANYNFLVRKAWVDALHDATNARKTHNRLIELEPENMDARLIQGVHEYVVGSLSFGYRMLGFLAGFHGDRNRGIQTLRMVAQKGNTNRVDAEVFLAAIYRRERRPKDAIPLLDDLARRFPRNYLLRFEMVQMYGDLGDKPAALAEIAKIRSFRETGAPGFKDLPPAKIDYLEGNLLFWYQDLDRALDHMQRVAAKANELDLNTGIMSWMRLGQICDLQGRHAQAVTAYRQAISLSPQSEVAKESRGYLEHPYRRKP